MFLAAVETRNTDDGVKKEGKEKEEERKKKGKKRENGVVGSIFLD